MFQIFNLISRLLHIVENFVYYIPQKKFIHAVSLRDTVRKNQTGAKVMVSKFAHFLIYFFAKIDYIWIYGPLALASWPILEILKERPI